MKDRFEFHLEGVEALLLQGKKIDMAEPTFSRKLKTGVFGTDEVMKMCEVLEITEPTPIFLAQEVNCGFTK